MRTVLKISMGVVAVAIGLALIARFIVVPRNFPQTEGTIRVSGLDGPVDVYRDAFGIPHIYAGTEHDLLMAQGFVHAQDRFWQMEFQRRIGSGRLSEILGESALPQDRFIRTVGWHRTVRREVELLEPGDRALLEAYAQGVNAYLDSQRARGLEFTLLQLTGARFEPEPWTLLDTLTWGKVLAWDLSGNGAAELARAHIAARLGSSAAAELLPPYDPTYPVIVDQPLVLEMVPDQAFTGFGFGTGPGLGSNSLVVGPSRAASGAPLLANDPHLGIQMPSIWYEIGLHCQPMGPDCSLNVVGASLPGIPEILLGHNDRIAWGFTNLGADVQDYFVERQNPENPDQYEVDGEWVDMQIIREEIRVLGWDEPEVVRARITRHGPIINDVVGGVEQEWVFGWKPLALSWTALDPGTIVRGVLLLNKARDWDEFREALRYWDVPGQNAVYADIEGNIGYQSTGRVPIRRSGDGSAPVEGWTGDFEWEGNVPYEELPSVLNPPDSHLETANNAVVGSDYPYFLTNDWDPGHRARRLDELVEADDSVTVADVQAWQRDTSSLYSGDIMGEILTIEPSGPQAQRALDALRTWDGRTDRDSLGAALFEVLRMQLVHNTYGDELGEQLLGRAQGRSVFTALSDHLNNDSSQWFDDTNTLEIETKADILARSLDDALEFLSAELGSDMADWRWGDLHRAEFENQSLGQSGIGPVEWLLNRGPYEVDGSIESLWRASYSPSDPYKVSALSSYLQIIDLADFTRSLSMHTTGQSGHPFHPHYDDMIEPWRDHEYHPMLWTREQVEAAAAEQLRLEP